MPAEHDAHRHAALRAAVERVWLETRRLSRARRQVRVTLPTSPERLAGLDPAGEERIDVFLFRLGAAVAALIEDVLEPVLLAEHRLIFYLDVAEDLRTLEATGALASAEAALAIRERVRHHHRIATLAPEARATALNAAWADGEAMAKILGGLAAYIQRNGFGPKRPPFGKARP